MMMCLECGEVLDATAKHDCPLQELADELEHRKRTVSGLLTHGVENTRRVMDIETQLAQSNRRLLTMMRVTAQKLEAGLMRTRTRRLPE